MRNLMVFAIVALLLAVVFIATPANAQTNPPWCPAYCTAYDDYSPVMTQTISFVSGQTVFAEPGEGCTIYGPQAWEGGLCGDFLSLASGWTATCDMTDVEVDATLSVCSDNTICVCSPATPTPEPTATPSPTPTATPQPITEPCLVYETLSSDSCSSDLCTGAAWNLAEADRLFASAEGQLFYVITTTQTLIPLGWIGPYVPVVIPDLANQTGGLYFFRCRSTGCTDVDLRRCESVFDTVELTAFNVNEPEAFITPLDGVSLLGNNQWDDEESEGMSVMGFPLPGYGTSINAIYIAARSMLTTYQLISGQNDRTWLFYMAILIVIAALMVGARLLFKPPDV